MCDIQHRYAVILYICMWKLINTITVSWSAFLHDASNVLVRVFSYRSVCLQQDLGARFHAWMHIQRMQSRCVCVMLSHSAGPQRLKRIWNQALKSVAAPLHPTTRERRSEKFISENIWLNIFLVRTDWMFKNWKLDFMANSLKLWTPDLKGKRIKPGCQREKNKQN